MKSFLVILILFLAPQICFSYVPRGKFILSKTARSHGAGAYKIELEVQIKTSTGVETIKELWTVGANENLRLEASGGGSNRWEFEALYKDGKRFYLEGNQVKTYGFSRDFFEPFFMSHSSAKLMQMLVHQEIIANPSIQKKSSEKFDHSVEPYLRLARLNGTVQYAFGKATPANSQANKPGVWIEQDTFQVSKIRFKTQAEITAEDYQEYDNEFFWPKMRQVQWNTQMAEIKTISVKSLKPNVADPKLELKDLEAKASRAKNTPQDPLIREFYSRFR